MQTATRQQLEGILWEHAEPMLYVSREMFVSSLADWDIEPIIVDHEIAFVLLTRGSEFHFESLGRGHPITMLMIRSILEPILNKHGHADTRTPKDDKRQNRFNKIFGFKMTGEDEFDNHYRIEALQCR